MRVGAGTLAIAAAWSTMASAQVLIEPGKLPRLVERLDPRPDDHPLACEVTPTPPALDFALHLQTGYLYHVSLDQFQGAGHKWIVMTEVTPVSGEAVPARLIDTVELPAVSQRGAESEGRGAFLVGEGRYRVRWMLFDESGRVCRKQWEVDTARRTEGRAVSPLTAPGAVADRAFRGLRKTESAKPEKETGQLTILLDAAPFVPGISARSALRPRDRSILLGALSALLETLPATPVRLIAFNLEQQRVLYRNESTTSNALGELALALQELELAKVDLNVLERPAGHLDVISNLINAELHAKPAPAAVLFLGPQERYRDAVPLSQLTAGRSTSPRFLFFRFETRWPQERLGFPALGGRSNSRNRVYRADAPAGPVINNDDDALLAPRRVPLPMEADTISRTVHELGGKTIDLRTPVDLAKALEELRKQLASHR